jgi:hypothetical protein
MGPRREDRRALHRKPAAKNEVPRNYPLAKMERVAAVHLWQRGRPAGEQRSAGGK